MMVVQLSPVGKAEGMGCSRLTTHLVVVRNARSDHPSGRKVVKVLDRHIEPSPTSTQATEQVVKNLWIHRNSDGGASNVTLCWNGEFLFNLTDEIVDDFFFS